MRRFGSSFMRRLFGWEPQVMDTAVKVLADSLLWRAQAQRSSRRVIVCVGRCGVQRELKSRASRLKTQNRHQEGIQTEGGREREGEEREGFWDFKGWGENPDSGTEDVRTLGRHQHRLKIMPSITKQHPTCATFTCTSLRMFFVQYKISSGNAASPPQAASAS